MPWRKGAIRAHDTGLSLVEETPACFHIGAVERVLEELVTPTFGAGKSQGESHPNDVTFDADGGSKADAEETRACGFRYSMAASHKPVG